ncbi:MAG: diaminopimelate epimerase [Gemmatimonadaceae bacterium]|nr:diaminopimelate epimerase [Gemmatimonadaceae bacterium]
MKFYKMSGSGNDFVFIDGIGQPDQATVAMDPDFVRTVCAAHTGVGADGLAVFLPDAELEFSLAYFNRDGSVGELCGNASLCAVRLSNELGLARQSGLRFRTPAGVINGRIRDGRPEVDLQAVQGLRPDAGIPRRSAERALGFVDSGVPHLVVRVDSLQGIPLDSRGPELRHHASLPAGANVNWVAKDPVGAWEIRTFERGVEAETLACGTGAVAAAVLLEAWGESGDSTTLRTKSGQPLQVRLKAAGGGTIPTLAGEGRIVFEGTLREL